MLYTSWFFVMIGLYCFVYAAKSETLSSLKIIGKGVKNSMANDDDNNGNGQLILDSRTKQKALNV